MTLINSPVPWLRRLIGPAEQAVGILLVMALAAAAAAFYGQIFQYAVHINQLTPQAWLQAVSTA